MPIEESKYHLHFPDFDATDYSSDGGGSSYEVELAAARKEDEDVAVFMAIAKMLSMESLLHLLQGQARAALADIAGDGYKTKTQETRRKAPIKKRFRFAKDKRRRGVFCEIFEIESIKEMDLWWSDDESHEMRRSAVRTVKQMRQSAPEFTHSVETIVRAPLVDSKSRKHTQQVESAMKYLIENSHPRGLEFHIVPLLDQIRSASIQAVLEEQETVEGTASSYEESSRRISAVAMAFSLLNRTFSERMGSCDRVSALNAMITQW